MVRMLIDWLDANDILSKLYVFAAAMDAYAQRAGLPDRQHGWSDDAKRQISQFEDELEAEERSNLAASLRAAEQAFYRAANAGNQDLTTRATTLVREKFGLSWPWLVLDLSMECFTVVSRYVVGCDIVTAIRLVFPDPLAPNRVRKIELLSAVWT